MAALHLNYIKRGLRLSLCSLFRVFPLMFCIAFFFRKKLPNHPQILAGLSSGAQTVESHVVEIVRDMEDELPRQMKKLQVQDERTSTSSSRVPHIVRSLDEDAYTPQFISFGPYHHGTKALGSADKYKWFFLRKALNMNKKVPLRMYLEEMDRVEQKVKSCYEDDIQMETDERIKMLLLDGCFILGYLGILDQVEDHIQKQDEVVIEESTVDNKMLECSTIEFMANSSLPSSRLPPPEVGTQTPQEQDKPVAEGSKHTPEIHTEGPERGIAVKGVSEETAIITPPHLNSIRYDLLMMENQLPFFVLQKIYDLATAGTPVERSLILKDKVDQILTKLLAPYPVLTSQQSFVYHLLHCCHLKFRPAMANGSSSNSKSTDDLQPWGGATDLYKAGIKFKGKKCNVTESLLDIELVSGRTLMIPTLSIDDSTSSIFRNLIAFEQSCTGENYFVAYAFFMGELMRTPGDVTLLVNQGVVKNLIGADNEVSDFFNNLVKGVGFDVNGNHFLSSTFEELKSSYNSVGRRHFADLKQNYCRSPWLAISVVAAAIVLVCTVVQTVYAVIR